MENNPILTQKYCKVFIKTLKTDRLVLVDPAKNTKEFPNMLQKQFKAKKFFVKLDFVVSTTKHILRLFQFFKKVIWTQVSNTT